MSPWVPGAIRAYLLDDAGFVTASASRVGTRLPSDMTKPFVQVRVIGNISLSDTSFAKSPLVQVDCWASPGGPVDPEVQTWDLAELAATRLAIARNVRYQNMVWSARLVDGPIATLDTSRGESSPLYGSLIRVELKTHTR